MVYVISMNPSNYPLAVAEWSDAEMTGVAACVDMLKCHLGRCDGAPITVCWHLLSMYEPSLTLHYLKMEREAQTQEERRQEERENERERERERDSGIHQHTSTMFLSCKTWLITARSILLFLPPLLFPSSTVPVCSSPASLPPTRANNLQGVIWLLWLRACWRNDTCTDMFAGKEELMRLVWSLHRPLLCFLPQTGGSERLVYPYSPYNPPGYLFCSVHAGKGSILYHHGLRSLT